MLTHFFVHSVYSYNLEWIKYATYLYITYNKCVITIRITTLSKSGAHAKYKKCDTESIYI